MNSVSAVIGVQQGNQFVSPESTYNIALFLYLYFRCFWKCWPEALHDWHPTEQEGQTLPEQVTVHVDCIWRLQT